MRDPTTPIDTGLHELTLLPDTRLLLDRVYEAVGHARREVMVECYIVSSDRQGDELARVLGVARNNGSRVRVLYDPLGSQHTDPAYFESLREAGIEVRSYGEILHLRGASLIAPRDHGRIIVADHVAFTGGAAWGEQWLPKERGGRGWHDVCCRVVGPCVEDFKELFEHRWSEAGDHPNTPQDYDTRHRYPDVRLVGDTPSRKRCRVYEAYVEAFKHAKDRIWIGNSYFFPSRATMLALAKAARRGVDVRIVLPGESDLPMIKRAARAQYSTWIKAGFKIFEYAKTVMHAKYAVVDDAWASIGTFNVNPVSVGLSNEVNLFVFDPPFVACVAEQFQRDVAASRLVTLEEVEARSLWQRVADDLAKEFWDATDLVFGPR